MYVMWNCRNGKCGKLSHSNYVIGGCSNGDLHVKVCSSAHCGCVVKGSVAMVAFRDKIRLDSSYWQMVMNCIFHVFSLF